MNPQNKEKSQFMSAHNNDDTDSSNKSATTIVNKGSQDTTADTTSPTSSSPLHTLEKLWEKQRDDILNNRVASYTSIQMFNPELKIRTILYSAGTPYGRNAAKYLISKGWSVGRCLSEELPYVELSEIVTNMTKPANSINLYYQNKTPKDTILYLCSRQRRIIIPIAKNDLLYNEIVQELTTQGFVSIVQPVALELKYPLVTIESIGLSRKKLAGDRYLTYIAEAYKADTLIGTDSVLLLNHKNKMKIEINPTERASIDSLLALGWQFGLPKDSNRYTLVYTKPVQKPHENS